MYSTEQRRRALDEYFSRGVTLREVCESLGYPDRSTLGGWARADPRHDPSARGRSPYALETKLRAVAMLESGAGVADIAARLGIRNPRCVYAWSRRYEIGGAAALADASTEVRVARVAEAAPVEGGEEELRERVRRLEIENAVLREVLDVLKADPRSDASELSNREKALVAERLRGGFPLAELLACLHLARSTFYYERAAIMAGDRLSWLRPLVREAFEAGRCARGYRFVHAWIRLRGVRVSEKVVRRVMREDGLRVPYDGRRRRGYSSYRGETAAAPPNLVARDFRSALPDWLWLTDITEFRIPAGKVYLSTVLDCFDGRLPAWSIGTSPDAELANSSLLGAIARRGGDELTVVHGDRGCHYRWPGWVRICEENGVVRSMSAKGCSPDNSRMEGLFGTVKNEFLHSFWRGNTSSRRHAPA